MVYFFFFVTIVLFFFSLIRLELFHPAFITFIVWGSVVFIYVFFNSSLYDLSDNIYLVLFIYLLGFLIGTIYYYITFGIKSWKKKKSFNNDGIYYDTTALFNFVFSITVYLFFRYILILKNGTTLYELTVQGNMPFDIKVLMYFDKISLCYFFYLVVYEKIDTKKKIFLVLFFITYTLKFSKMDLMQLFMGVVLVLWVKKKIKIKHLILLFLLVFSLITFLHFYRIGGIKSDESLFNVLMQLISVYFLSPLKAFDCVVNKEVIFSNNLTFSFFGRVFSKLLGYSLISRNGFDGWVYVPYPTNVYTALCPPYSDYGLLGLFLFSFIFSFMLTFLFEKRDNKFCGLLYVIMFYVLVFQFFSDIVCGYTSAILQIVFWSFIIVQLKSNKLINRFIKIAFSLK